MTFNEALFILRHGSAEGKHKYLQAVKIIENEVKCLQERNERLQAEKEAMHKDLIVAEEYAFNLKSRTKVRAITKESLLRMLPGQLQINKGKAVHYGSYDGWCIFGSEITKAIEDIFAEEGIFKSTIECAVIQEEGACWTSQSRTK